MMADVENVLNGETKFVKVKIENRAPVICGGSFELKLFGPVCHQSSAMVFWITNSMSAMDYWNIESFLLDGVSSIGGVENEFGGSVSIGFDPFLFRNEIEEGVSEQGKTKAVESNCAPYCSGIFDVK